MVTPRAPGFRGRSQECELLDRLLQNVRGGHSAILVIRGEAGVGKSALLRYAAQQASDFRVARISGVEAEMELPFAGLHQLCRPMLGQLDCLPKPQQDALRVALGDLVGHAPDRFLIALATLNLLAEVAEERPLVCLVDDAQWLDRASGQVLGFVARRLLAESVAIVFGVREPSDERELAGLPELSLEGLGDEDARSMLDAVVPGRLDERVRDRIVAETRGNPLALLELSRMGTAELAGGFAVPNTADLPSQIEGHYVERVSTLPKETQQLVLLAAADPVGDAVVLWRAAQTLGIERTAAEPAEADQLLEIGARVRFRHPLVRSAVYNAASPEDRRAVHGALAAATDPIADPDRRAWHRAYATQHPEEDVARELLRCADRAERRGGIAASAAFLERAVTLTPNAPERASRALTAARAKFEVGDFAASESLLAIASAGPLDELGQAQVERRYAQIAFDMRRGSDAPLLLLRAAQRLERIDADLAQQTHLEALVAVIYAAGLAKGTNVVDVARAAGSSCGGTEPSAARQQLLRGLASRFMDGYSQAAPILRVAFRDYRASERQLDSLCVGFILTAMELWDDEAWFELASSQAELARSTGRLIFLPYALDYLAGFYLQSGELAEARRLLTEAEGLHQDLRADTLPYIPSRLAAWQGDATTALNLVDAMKSGALARGEGGAISAAEYGASILYNGLGQYVLACEAAERAIASDDLVTASWAMPELIEAASRCDRKDVGHNAADQLSERAAATGTNWALGTAARGQAMVEGGQKAEDLHREGIELLGHTRMVTQLARAQLCYGEWLRRVNRRGDARRQLRLAYDTFASMGAEGFSERARRELLATGEKVRKRRDDTRNDLTPQEEHIARLARDGQTNSEIGAELFISARTVEWHLRKVFTKLGISSRKGLQTALPVRD